MNDDVQRLVRDQLEQAEYELALTREVLARIRSELSQHEERARAKEAEVTKWKRALES